MIDDEPSNRSPDTSVRDVARILFRHRRKTLFTMGVVLLSAILASFVPSPQYRSESKLMLQLGRESVSLDPTATTGRVVSVARTRESEINSELEILRSRELTEEVVDAVGVDVLVPGSWWPAGAPDNPDLRRQSASELLEENLQIEVLKDSNILRLSFTAGSPDLARQTLATVIDRYLDRHIAAYRTHGSYEFFSGETGRLEESLQETEARLRDLKNRTHIGSLEEQRAILMERVGALQQDIERNHAGLSASRARIQSIREALADLPETLVTQQTAMPNPALDGMRQRLYELQLREQDILSKYNPQSDLAREIHQQVEEAEALMRAEVRDRTQVTSGINTTHQQMKTALLSEQSAVKALEAQDVAMRENLDRARHELQQLNASEVEMAQLERQLASLRDNYRRYSENLEQARIDQELETQRISNISVIQAATASSTPVSPRRGLNLTLGLLLAVFGGVGVAFGAEYLDHSIRRPHDIERRLQLPTLVSIPDLARTPAGYLGRMESRRLAPGPRPAGALPQAVTGSRTDEQTQDAAPRSSVDGRVATTGPVRNSMSGFFDALRDQLSFVANGQFSAPCVLAVTGCRRGEGVSTVAAHLAVALGRESGDRVMLLDAKPSLSHGESPRRLVCLGREVAPGKGLTGDDPVAFGADPIGEVLASLKGRFRFIVIDAPAVQETSLAARVCGEADGVILVVAAERTRVEVAEEAKQMLIRADAKLMGVVLNRRRFHVPHWLYEKL